MIFYSSFIYSRYNRHFSGSLNMLLRRIHVVHELLGQPSYINVMDTDGELIIFLYFFANGGQNKIDPVQSFFFFVISYKAIHSFFDYDMQQIASNYNL